jgi:glyoxylase-like metal-dependent hydrolase (beta-lactamase superfamily II)
MMKIIPVAVGELDTFESDVFAGGDKQKKVLFYSYVFIIIVDGQAILVDASFGDFDYCKKNGPNECRLLNNDILDILKDNGYNAEDIKTIVLTHCHWDHIGGYHNFQMQRSIAKKKSMNMLWLIPLRILENTLFHLRNI